MKTKLQLVPTRARKSPLDSMREELAFVRSHLEDLERRLNAALGANTAA
jgi:hypothetical protein